MCLLNLFLQTFIEINIFTIFCSFIQPGPLPGMRPPMGGGAMHQASQKSSGPMGFLMPLYTLAIVGFFVYTIMKVGFVTYSKNICLY